MFEPAGHEQGGEGHGDAHREEGEFDEVFGEEGPEGGDGGAEDFADADLFGALFGGEGGEGEEAETGDEDGEGGEDDGDVALACFGFEFLRIVFVVEAI